MNDEIILGKDCVLLAWYEDEWVPFACLRTISLTPVTDFIEVSLIGSGKWRDWEPTANSATGSMEGIEAIFKEDHLSIADIRYFQFNHVKILFRFQRLNMSAQYYTSEFYGWITSTPESISFDNAATFTAEIKVTGAITDLFTPSPIIGSQVQSIYYHTDGSSEVIFQDDRLIGVTVVGAWRQTDYVVITTGTVLVNEIFHDPVTGEMSWVIPMDEKEFWHIQYR